MYEYNARLPDMYRVVLLQTGPLPPVSKARNAKNIISVTCAQKRQAYRIPSARLINYDKGSAGNPVDYSHIVSACTCNQLERWNDC